MSSRNERPSSLQQDETTLVTEGADLNVAISIQYCVLS